MVRWISLGPSAACIGLTTGSCSQERTSHNSLDPFAISSVLPGDASSDEEGGSSSAEGRVMLIAAGYECSLIGVFRLLEHWGQHGIFALDDKSWGSGVDYIWSPTPSRLRLQDLIGFVAVEAATELLESGTDVAPAAAIPTAAAATATAAAAATAILFLLRVLLA